MTIKTILLIIIVTIIGCIILDILLSLIGLLKEYKYYLVSKKSYNIALSNSENINMSENYLSFIVEICRVEVGRTIDSLRSINAPYDILRLDEDVKDISEKVFNSLNKNNLMMFTTIIEPSYINDFIINNVKIILLAQIAALNNRIRSENE